MFLLLVVQILQNVGSVGNIKLLIVEFLMLVKMLVVNWLDFFVYLDNFLEVVDICEYLLICWWWEWMVGENWVCVWVVFGFIILVVVIEMNKVVLLVKVDMSGC